MAKTKDFNWLVPEQRDQRAARHGVCDGDGGAQPTLSELPRGEGPFVAPGPNSILHDPVLTALAAQMNESIRNVLPSRPEPRAKVDFLLTDLGLIVVWDVATTDDEWRDEFASGEGMEHMEGKSNDELADIFDLPWGRGA